MTPDHITLTSCGHYTWGLSSAVDLVCEFASQGQDHEEALRLDEGALLEAKRRLDNLVSHLGLLNRREAA